MADVSSLGIGSSGVLSADVIDKLKANDHNLTVKPIEKKQDLNAQKVKSLDLLTSLSSTLETSASNLKDSSMYQKRTVTGTNSGVEVTASDGVGIQDFTIADVKLAKKDVLQSGSFSSPTTSKVATDSGTLNLHIDGTDYKIDYDDSMSYEDLKNKINDVAGDGVNASILQTSDDAYSLIITSDDTGKDQEIALTDLDGNLNDELKSDILKSDTFDDKDDEIATDSGSLTLTADGTDFTFDYDDATTLTDLADMINNDEDASKDVFAAVIEDNDGKYSLVVSAKNPAENQDITIKDNDSALSTKLTDDATSDSGDISEVQGARDATFKYNGIELTRSTNSIDDIQLGITIDLKEDDASANISITQDTQPIKDELANFVDSYNTMQKQLDTMTLADLDAGKVGLFNGDNSINNISRSLKELLTSRDSDTNQGLSQYGITLERNGLLKFNDSAFDDKMKDNPDDVAGFFSGKTTISDNDVAIHKDGIFKKLYDNISGLTSTKGVLTTLNNGLSRESDQLEENRTKSIARLDAQYDTMTARFRAYDSVINQMNNSFTSLQQQIDAAANGK